ncbi:MAG: hypothetical protein LC804_02565 [Acidobacteria bacterium]|nr:hypothetical protein [Acidobacteriota bacterium]
MKRVLWIALVVALLACLAGGLVAVGVMRPYKGYRVPVRSADDAGRSRGQNRAR